MLESIVSTPEIKGDSPIRCPWVLRSGASRGGFLLSLYATSDAGSDLFARDNIIYSFEHNLVLFFENKIQNIIPHSP